MTKPYCRVCSQPIPTAAFSIVDAPGGAQLFHDDADLAAAAKVSLRIAQCVACGLVQSLSPAVPYFRKAISAAGLSPGMRRYRMEQFSAFVQSHRLDGERVLEAGCGNGDMLPILRAAGVIPFGLEYQDQDVEGEEGESAIINAYPEGGLPLAGSPYAAFVCLNFLEHAPQPRDFLFSLRASLTPAGVGLLEVPNYARQRALGRAFDYVTDHLAYFTLATLRLTLELSGFEVRRIQETRGGENVEAWVQPRPLNDLNKDYESIEASRRALARLLQEKVGAIAIWGASHQALTLLSGLPRNAVHFIIDSAIFKQGKFAPGSGTPVIAPSPAVVKQVDHIVIIASGYETEIALTLRRDLEYSGTIWTFEGGGIRTYD